MVLELYQGLAVVSFRSGPLDVTAGRAAKATGVCRTPIHAAFSCFKSISSFMHVVSSYLFINITLRVFLSQLAYTLYSKYLFVFQGTDPKQTHYGPSHRPKDVHSRPSSPRVYGVRGLSDHPPNRGPFPLSRLQSYLPASIKR